MKKFIRCFLLLSLVTSFARLTYVSAADASKTDSTQETPKKSMKERLEGVSERITAKGQAISDSNRVVIDDARASIAKANEVITPEQEYYIGRMVAAKVLDNYKLYNNKTATTYVNNICTAITQASDIPELYNGYHVGILDTDEINGMSSPGGHILITRGLLECATSEDQVAAVIAHEIAHIQLKHSIKAIKSTRTIKALSATADAAVAIVGTSSKEKDDLEEGANEIVDTISHTGYSKKQEYEADQKATTLMADAGYNPKALSEILEVLKEREPQQTEGMVKTHPSAKNRISNARGYIRTAGYGKDFNDSKRTARFAAVHKLL